MTNAELVKKILKTFEREHSRQESLISSLREENTSKYIWV